MSDFERKGVQLNAPTAQAEMNQTAPVNALHRRPIRLRDYDYAQQGAYFVTISAQQREAYFEEPVIKQIAENCWLDIPSHFPHVELDEWILMPNHLHGILVIAYSLPTQKHRSENSFSRISPSAKTLGVIIRTFKGAVTTLCRRAGKTEFIWQRNYHEHIVRNEAELNRIRQYILDNPAKWDEDFENPNRLHRPL